MSAREIALEGGSPWGFRIHGGYDVGSPLKVSRVNPGSKAASKGIREGDIISSINGTPTAALSNSEAHVLLKHAGPHLRLSLNEDGGLSPRRRIKHASVPTVLTDEKISSFSQRIEAEDSGKEKSGGEEAAGKTKIHVYLLNSKEEGDPIDNMPSTISFSPTFKATAPRPGVWSPARRASDDKVVVKEESEERKKLEDEPIPPVWTPKSAQASPVLEKKEFRPVSFESPTLPRKKYIQDDKRESSVPPPWQQPGGDKPPELAKSTSSPALSLPKAPNPTVTLLQKAREGHLPRGAHYLNREMKETPDEVIIEKFISASSKNEVDTPRKLDSGRKKVAGIGPTTKEGIPLVLRSEVTDDNREKWYKRMYDSLHKYGSDDDFVTVKYRTSPSRKGAFSYQTSSNSGYQSEPESLNYSRPPNKCITLDGRRLEKDKENELVAVTLPRSQISPPRRDFREYKNQPGRIEDYEPGHSSISELEANKWWDEVLEIFDKGERKERPICKVTSPKSFTHYASGYISDPQYVYKRSEDELQSPPSSEEQKEAYRIIQKGGEIPLKGLRKPAPQRPKEFLKNTEIEYLPLSPTLTKIRVHKQNITPLKDLPFYVSPLCFQNPTFSYQNFPVGICNSYSQVQIFSPLVSSQSLFKSENQKNTSFKNLDLQKSDSKFSVRLQNISGSHEYVQIVPKPRNSAKTLPIYANLSDCSRRTSYPGRKSLESERIEKGNSEEKEFESRKKYFYDSGNNLVNFTTFSDLKRVVPSIVGRDSLLKKPLEQKLSKRPELIAKNCLPLKSKKRENFLSRIPSRRLYICDINNSKKIIKKSDGNKPSKKGRRKVLLNSKKNEVNNIFKERNSNSNIADKEKPTTKLCKPRKKIERQKELEAHLKATNHLDFENKRTSFKHTSTFCFSQIKGIEDSVFPTVLPTNTNKHTATMSPIYESLDDPLKVKSNVEESVTEKFRSRSFSPDVRRKMFKLPDMNKPISAKKKACKSSPTVKVWSKMMLSYPNHRSRADVFDSNVKYLRDRIKRKLAEDVDGKAQFEDDSIETTTTVKKEKSRGTSLKTSKYLKLSRTMSSSLVASPPVTLPAAQKDERLSKTKNKLSLELLKSKKSSESMSGSKSLASKKQKETSTIPKSSTSYSLKNFPSQQEDKKKSVKVNVAVSSKAKPAMKKSVEPSASFKKSSAAGKICSSPCPSASSCRSVLSEKSEDSEKNSSLKASMSPTTRFFSSQSSMSRISGSSRSISPGSPSSKIKTKNSVLNMRIDSSKTNELPVISNSRNVLSKGCYKKPVTKLKRITGHSLVAECPKNILSVSMSVSSSENSVCKNKSNENIKFRPRQLYESDGSNAEKNELIKGTNLVRTDSFFQNLFLRDSQDRATVFEKEICSSVLDRARSYEWKINWPETYKSEPSLSLVSLYLNQKRPVSLSKFKSLDRNSKMSSSRSVSPLGNFHSESFQVKLQRFDSVGQFGDVPFENEISILKERSSSEPPLGRFSTYSSDEKHIDKLSAGNSTRTSPCSSKFLSSRQLQSCKPYSEISEISKKRSARSRSAGALEAEKSAVDFQQGSLDKSISFLSLSNFNDHLEYQTYVLELMHSRRKCERFRELHKFYSNLERIGKLEEAASAGELRPRLKSEDVIDFDRWKKIRTQERAEAELKALVDSLVKVQKEKDLLFRASDAEALRWKGDRGLRIKERSVEDLKEQFSKNSFENSELSVCHKEEKEIKKRSPKPLWKESHLVESTKSLCHIPLSNKEKLITGEKFSKVNGRIGKEYGYSLKAWKNLSAEEINILKGESNQIKPPDNQKNVSEDKWENFYGRYEILVPDDDKIKFTGESPLHVRCSSALSKSQTFTPIVKRKEEHLKAWKKSDSVAELPFCWEREEKMKVGSPHLEEKILKTTKTTLLRSKSAPSSKPMTESEKKRLSMSLSREVIEKMNKASGKGPLFPKETLGALAAAGSKVKTSTNFSGFLKDKKSLLPSNYQKLENFSKWNTSSFESCKVVSAAESESKSGSSAASTTTALTKNPMDVLKKVQYFEGMRRNSNELITSQSEQDDTKTQNDLVSVKNFSQAKKNSHLISSSLENLNDYFGQQKQFSAYSTQNKCCKKSWTLDKEKVIKNCLDVFPVAEDVYDVKKFLDRKNIDSVPYCSVDSTEHRILRSESSNDSLFSGRSRSISPDPTKYYRAYLKMVKCGSVKKLRSQFESWEDLLSVSSDKDFKLPPRPRRFASDPELTRDLLKRFGTHPTRVTVRGHEVGDVRWLKSKFEKGFDRTRGRGHCRSPRLRSPLTAADRFMPRINVISKTAKLQMQGFETCQNSRLEHSKNYISSKSLVAFPEDYCSLIDYTKDHGGYFYTGEVEKLKRKFEKLQEEQKLSILGQMYTSTPEVNELRNIAPYLECSWVAHRHPEITKTVSSPDLRTKRQDFPKKVPSKPRPNSSSPVRPKHLSSILKSAQPPTQKTHFGDQKFDPSIHRPRYRYRPDCEQQRRPRQGDPAWCSHWNRPTVTFQDFITSNIETEFPDLCSESPRKYVESEVTIHYKSPVRSEAKEILSEDELARRQAESMKRIYKEERRRKYLQELQDMNSRRHTDNFTPSQKSPISLSRYDDFPLDSSQAYAKTKDSSSDSVTVARGLYDFVGRRPRELAFRRGDIIFIIRKLDKYWCEGELNGVVGLFPLSYVEVIPHAEISMKFGRARAKYDFVPQTPLELSAQKGDVITLIRRIDENWFEGRIDDKTGIIPVSYCHVLALPQANKTPDRMEKLNKPIAAPAAHSLIHNGTGMTSKHYYTPYLSGVDPSGRSQTTSANIYDHHVTPEMLIDEALMQLDEEFDLKRTSSKSSTNNPSFRVNPRPEPALYQVLFNHAPNNDDELELIQGETVTVVEKCGDGWYIGSKTSDGKLGIFPGTHVRRLAPEFV